MKPATTVIPKKRGPKPTGKGTPIMVRLQPDVLAKVDALRKKQTPSPSRPELIRQIIDKATEQ
ncbi:CopG family transcriptional regulator [Mesorhizobium sp. M7A.T.Ca.TU.009.02.1.1]|nr:CopG family transcriptional regulator [Mesorhizobium sp. M7A.T.Ca.US.000.02.1.1]RUT87429.1 CopG family transcriptional regulator [Mesorhizobium sp. M7A.T.Ca.US.000.02.2.1]RUT99457.1 CopG family transcriptional regulator [Mesorhizobium sp. M7A.T.Ca.TU.009.02.1.1]RUU51318.1 CopG family transcriptional regulator [Mesorhizobium sp. M7A.T.Ca.TU.009.01.1.1]RUU84543.1 CopG family transcriptional regulator [Mesorhizobium sp. M7A.T.Ca.TU.009.01.1.2]